MTIANSITALAGYINRKSVRGLNLLPGILTEMNQTNTAFWKDTGTDLQLVDFPSMLESGPVLIDPADYFFRVNLLTTDTAEQHQCDIGAGAPGQQILLVSTFHEDAPEGCYINLLNTEAAIVDAANTTIYSIGYDADAEKTILKWDIEQNAWKIVENTGTVNYD